MLSYQDLYEILRKEKYSESLQQLPKNFLEEVAIYLRQRKEASLKEGELFQEQTLQSKKQLENSFAIFKELVLRRKRKLLNLVFVAAETGIMKRDYETMLGFERELFDKLVKSVGEADKVIEKQLYGRDSEDAEKYRLVIFNQSVEQFVDMNGSLMGPFASGELVNLDSKVAEILLGEKKVAYVDE